MIDSRRWILEEIRGQKQYPEMSWKRQYQDQYEYKKENDEEYVEFYKT